MTLCRPSSLVSLRRFIKSLLFPLERVDDRGLSLVDDLPSSQIMSISTLTGSGCKSMFSMCVFVF